MWVQERLCDTVLQYSSSELESTLTVYWEGVGGGGMYCTDPVIGEFPFLRGMLFCVKE
jgi:hypothetical protein